MRASVSFKARGHELISAIHKTTLEITKDNYLTKRGDCIIAIASEKACRDLNEELKNLIRKDGSRIKVILQCKGLIEIVEGYGSSKLSLNDDRSIVIRKSSYFDDRTLAISSNKAARDLSRDFVRAISNNEAVIMISIEAEL